MILLKALVAVLLFASPVAFAQSPLKTVDSVDVGRYAGTWYQIARANYLPFEWGCVCSRQVLSPNAQGHVDVWNTCNFWSVSGSLREIRGVATVADTATNAKLTVDFGMPWKGDYWIIGLDPQYRWAVVSDPSRWSLYVLSRTPTIEPELYRRILATVDSQVDVTALSVTTQLGCSYP